MNRRNPAIVTAVLIIDVYYTGCPNFNSFGTTSHDDFSLIVLSYTDPVVPVTDLPNRTFSMDL